MIRLLILLFPLILYGRALQTLFPSRVPLTVRSPYLNCMGHLSFNFQGIQNIYTRFNDHSNDFPGWDPSLDLLLNVLVRVDNNTYSIVESNYNLQTSANYTNVVVSPTQTTLVAEAGPMQFNLTFLNPIEPEDWVKQSIPLSYLSLTAKSLDGASHAVQVYSDLRADWVSGNQSQMLMPFQLQSRVIGHMVKRQNPTLSDEVSADTEWGTLYHFIEALGNITLKIDNISVSQRSFQLNGALDPLTSVPEPSFIPNATVVATSRNLGTIQVTQDPVVWIVGYTTDTVSNYTDLSGATQQRTLFYKTKYPGKDYYYSGGYYYSYDEILVVDFMDDFINASSRAQQLDQKILQDTASISGLLVDLVSLATAQVFGSIRLTVATNAYGGFNKSDVMATMKGSNTTRVNAVETLYSAFPMFMYMNATLGGLFLEPLLRLQVHPEYTNSYAAPDLGTSYPHVTVSNAPHKHGVEYSGDMLIMTYAHARASGDGSLISRYYRLLTTWADYLSKSTLLIRDQYSADELSTDNQTNLAIKGIIAIEAMSQMSSIVNQTEDFDKYSNTATRLYAQWRDLALTSDKHLLGVYGNRDSWTSGYNLFADVWLNTSVVEPSVFDGQSSFIDNFTLTTTIGDYGMPNDNLTQNPTADAKFNWNLFVAAMTSDQDLRTNLISIVHSRAFYRLGSRRYPHVAFDGPEQGAMYAPLVLKVPARLTANPTTGMSPNPTTTGTSSKSRTGIARGTLRGILGGIAALLAIVAVALVVWRRQRQSHRRTSTGPSSSGEVISQGTQVTVTPFNPTWPGLNQVAPLDVGPQTGWQQRLVHRPSSVEDSPLQVPVPVGLSSKELARLRSLANGSRSQPMNEPPSNPPSTVGTDGVALGGAAAVATSSPEARVHRSEVNVLRDEMQRLHAVISESPPSYASGAA